MIQECTPARAANIVKQKKILNDHFSSRQAFGFRKQKITSVQKEEIKRRRYGGEDPMDLALEFGISAGYVRGLAQWNDRPYGA
jgi:hypothetical protein